MANEYRAKSFADAFRQARRDIGGGGQAVWIRPNGTRMTFNTNLKEEIPVNQTVYSPLLSSEDERLAERRYKEALESSRRALASEIGINLVQGKKVPTKMIPQLNVQNKEVGIYQINPNASSEESKWIKTLPQIDVVAQRTHHKMRKNSQTGELESAQENFYPVKPDYEIGKGNSVHYNFNTGEYEMIDKNGEILATSPDGSVLSDPSLWTQFHNGRNGDIEQSKQTFEQQKAAEQMANMRRDEENHTINSPLHILTDENGNIVVDKNGKPVYNGQLTTDQVVDGMNYGKQIFVDAVQNFGLDGVNHAILGGLKMATDGDYTSDNYLNGFFVSKDHVGGAGDFFEVEGPKSRFALNLINPTSLFTLGATTKFKLPEMTAVTTKGQPIRLSVPNAPASMYRIGMRANEGMGTITRNVGQGGQKSWVQHGGKHVAGTGSHIEVIPTQSTGLMYTPGEISMRPLTTMTYDLYPKRTWETKQIIPALNVEYEGGPESTGYQYERMLGNPNEVNSSAAPDVTIPGNVTVNGSNDKINRGRSNGRRLLKRTKARKSRQETGNIDISN